jgi:hypothetical protein
VSDISDEQAINLLLNSAALQVQAVVSLLQCTTRRGVKRPAWLKRGHVTADLQLLIPITHISADYV